MPTFTVGSELPASAQKVWQALKDAPKIFPKIAPHAIASMEHVDGPSEGAGAVTVTKFGSAALYEGAFVKEKLSAFDPATLTATTDEIEGGHFVQGFTKWSSTVKLTPISDKACKWETTVDFEGGDEAAIAPAIARAKEGIPKMLNGLTMYANSTA